MKENEEIVGLFRQKLGKAELPVNDGFWDTLQNDLSSAGKCRMLSLSFYRIAVAASVVLVLGMASAAFWYFSPQEDMEEAFTHVAVMAPGRNLDGDRMVSSFPNLVDEAHAKCVSKTAHPVLTADEKMAEGESRSVHVSIRVTQQVYGQTGRNASGGYRAGMGNGGYHHAVSAVEKSKAGKRSVAPQAEEKKVSRPLKSHNWALKAYMGTALPAGDFKMPLSAGLSVERSWGKRFSLEAGLQYNRLHDTVLPEGDHTYHMLALPVRMNVQLVGNDKFDLYALVGGSVEKCLAGAADNSFKAEPVQLAMEAGVGVRYKLNDRFALFAEPVVAHYFDTDSPSASLRTERPTNLNLLCGVRMIF